MVSVVVCMSFSWLYELLVFSGAGLQATKRKRKRADISARRAVFMVCILRDEDCFCRGILVLFGLCFKWKLRFNDSTIICVLL